MRRLVGLLVACAVRAQAAVWSPAYDGSANWTRQATGSNDFAVCRLDEGAGPGGGAALHLKDDNAGPFNHTLTYHMPWREVTALRGRTVWLSMRVRQRAASTSGCVGFALVVRGPSPVSRTIGTGARGETPWQTLRVKVRVPRDARAVDIHFHCATGYGRTGEAWFADWALTDDSARVPALDVADFRALDGFGYVLPPATNDTPEVAAYRRSYREQPPLEEDGKARPEIRAGTFWYRGTPHFFVGPWVYDATHGDWNTNGTDKLGIDHIAYREAPGTSVWQVVGFDSLQLSAAPARYGALVRGFPVAKPPKPWQPDWRQLERRQDEYFARFGGEMPLVVDFAFGYAGSYPDAVRRLLDQRKDAWHAFVPLCPETPEGAAYYRDYFLGGARSVLRRGANVFLYELFNESSYNCECRANRAAFAAEVARRYGTIAAANGVWGADFDSFADVAAQTDLRQYPGVWYDWCRFAADRYVALLEFGRRTLRGIDRRRNVYFTEQASGTPPAWRGMDYEKIAAALDVLALEGGFQYGSRSRYTARNMAEAVCATAGSRHLYNCDFYQALVRGRSDKALVNDEHYCTRFVDGSRVPSRATDYITSLWAEALHGLSASYFYVWDKRAFDYKDMKGAYENVRRPSYKSSSLLNPFNVRPDDLNAFGRFRREFEPYAARVLPRPRVKAPTVAVFFSKASEIHYGSFPRYDKTESPYHPPKNTIVSDWYLQLLHAQYPVEVVFERDLTRLGAEVQALVFPGCPCADDATLAAAQAFAARGGLVLTGPGCFAYDVYLKPRAAAKRGAFPCVRTCAEALDRLKRAGVRKYAELEPTDGGAPLSQVDVQVCDRGDFKLVLVFNLADGAVRPVRLRLRHLAGEGPWRLKDAVTGEVVSRAADAAFLARGFTFDLPPQERRVWVLEL